ncbi:MAG: asparagine synthase (glutamine-hydrolyzing), partial [Deltaproteobacteria bacterium]
MCGIAGIAGTWPDREARVERMAEAIAHRGPDDAGLWHDADCSLGHRRLALLDLSPAGRQPMSNEDGRVHVVFNGEIYNFAELRADLEGRGHRFRSRTDSEVLVHLYEEAGDEMVSRLRGMFAFALWDARERRLLLARDHFGQKPLFYAEQNGALLFASEIKALLAAGIPRDIDPRGVDLFLSLQFVPSPFTCYRAIRRLPPATILIRDAGGRTRLRQYWSLRARPASRGRLDAMVEETGARLRAAVAEQLVADVPVGLYLSGGIDSTLVLGRAASAAQGLRAFAVGYREAPYSELPHARRVARHHRVALEEVVLSPQAADPGELARLFDEPFSDPAALPVVHLARAARRHVTAVLTGDGGDELFGGYQHHVLAFWLMKLGQLSRARAAIARVALDRLPESVRRSPRWPRLRRILETLSHVEPAAALLHLRRQLDPELRARLYTPDFLATVADAEPSEILCAREAAPRTIEEALLWTDRL